MKKKSGVKIPRKSQNSENPISEWNSFQQIPKFKNFCKILGFRSEFLYKSSEICFKSRKDSAFNFENSETKV